MVGVRVYLEFSRGVGLHASHQILKFWVASTHAPGVLDISRLPLPQMRINDFYKDVAGAEFPRTSTLTRWETVCSLSKLQGSQTLLNPEIPPSHRDAHTSSTAHRGGFNADSWGNGNFLPSDIRLPGVRTPEITPRCPLDNTSHAVAHCVWAVCCESPAI